MLVFVYAVNGARDFLTGFWQLLVMLSVLNLADRLFIDGWWVGHTKAWTIPINGQDKKRKWLFGTGGMAVIAAALAGIMAIFL